MFLSRLKPVACSNITCGIFLRDLQRRIHVAERGREDQLVAGAGQLFDRTLGVRAFADVFEIGGFDLVAEFLDDRLAADLVLIGPAEIADRSEINEPDLELVRSGRRRKSDAAREQQSEPLLSISFSYASPIYQGEHSSRKTQRPISCVSNGLAVRDEHRSECGRSRRAAGAGAGNQHQHDDGGEIRHRGHQL